MPRNSKKNTSFGSPFDPKFQGTGKTRVDPAAARAHNRKEAVKMNEEKRLRPQYFITPNRSDTTDYDIFTKEYLARSTLAKMMKNLGDMHSGGIVDGGSYGESVPRSYTQARDSVKEWLVRADDQSFGDIVGNDEALAQLRDAITAPVEHKDLYEAYGMKAPKGALLYGPPGCGKTMFARAAASEMRRLYGNDVEFLSIAGTELQSGWVGHTEQRIKAIFKFGREYRAHHGHPLLVFIDEAEALLPSRDGALTARWEANQVATFLAEMDGVRESGVFMLLATNRPEAIDQAVLRDGRCDFKIAVKRPTAEAIRAILSNGFRSAGPVLDGMVDELTFAAMESLMDPSRVIVEAHLIKWDKGTLKDLGGSAFLLEHIVSGAMVASVPARAKRHAFTRDKAAGKMSGVQIGDVIAAVNDIFEENKGLDHTFALQEFLRDAAEAISQKGRVLQ